MFIIIFRYIGLPDLMGEKSQNKLLAMCRHLETLTLDVGIWEHTCLWCYTCRQQPLSLGKQLDHFVMVPF